MELLLELGQILLNLDICIMGCQADQVVERNCRLSFPMHDEGGGHYFVSGSHKVTSTLFLVLTTSVYSGLL